MVWVRLDDEFPEHPKIAQLTDTAFALFVSGLAYCNRNLTDGFIPSKVALGQLRYCDGNAVPYIRELENVGVWEPVSGGWQVHDYTDYQPSKQAVKAEREQTRERVQRHRNAKRNEGGNGVTNGGGNGGSNGVPGPGPGPEPSSRSKPPPGGDDADASSVDLVEQSFEQFWNDYPRHARNGKPGGGGSRKKALDRWRRMKAGERELALSAVDNYRDWCERPDGEFPAHATTWLNEQRWEQWEQPAADNVTSLNGRDPPNGQLAYNDPLRYQQLDADGTGPGMT